MLEIFYYFAPLLGGAAIAMLPGVNNYIAQYTKDISFAILINFLLGTVILSLIYLVVIPVSIDELRQVPLWSFFGGIYGTLTIVVMTLTPAKIGIGKTLSTFITARLISATVIDHFGWMAMPQDMITWLKIAGIGFALAGTFFILSVKASQRQEPEIIILYGVLCFLSGIASSLQSTTNATLLNQVDSLLFVTSLNFIANLALFVMIYCMVMRRRIRLAQPSKAYFCGFLSVLCSFTVIATMAFASSKIGVANTVVLSIITQMITSIIVDHFGWLRVARHPFSFRAILGLALLLFGAYLIVSN